MPKRRAAPSIRFYQTLSKRDEGERPPPEQCLRMNLEAGEEQAKAVLEATGCWDAGAGRINLRGFAAYYQDPGSQPYAAERVLSLAREVRRLLDADPGRASDLWAAASFASWDQSMILAEPARRENKRHRSKRDRTAERNKAEAALYLAVKKELPTAKAAEVMEAFNARADGESCRKFSSLQTFQNAFSKLRKRGLLGE